MVNLKEAKQVLKHEVKAMLIHGMFVGMSWLDGLNNWGKYIKAGPCYQTTTDTGGPFHATFSDIRIGDIGTTLGPSPPPSPPTPPSPAPPSPTPSGCTGCGYACGGDCGHCGRCNTKPGCMSKDTCLTSCNSGGNAMWCGGTSPTPPTPPPPPPTPPSPSSCPGGSLSACIALCPSDPPVA